MSSYYGWDANTDGSEARMNKMTIPGLSGAEIAALDKSKYALVRCIADGSGLLKDHLYLSNVAADAWIDVTQVQPHEHGASQTNGGDIYHVFAWGNPSFTIFQATGMHDLQKANWRQTVSGTATIEDYLDGTSGFRELRMRTNATNGSIATLQYPHLKCDFDYDFMFQSKVRFETASSLACHVGVGIDPLDIADSNTIKIQAEVCTLVNNNWFLRTANGSANSASDIGLAINTNSVGITLWNSPSDGSAEMYTNNADFTKTTNIATTGASDVGAIMGYSIKNNTGADRTLKTRGWRLVFRIDDSWTDY